MTKIKNNKLLSLIIEFVVTFSFFSVFENCTLLFQNHCLFFKRIDIRFIRCYTFYVNFCFAF